MLTLLLMAVVFAQAGPGNAILTPPQDVHITNTTVVQVPPMDPKAVTEASAIANQSLIVNTIQPVPVLWANTLCQLPNIWTTTPPSVTYDFPDVRQLADLIGLAALAMSGLALLGVALAAMFGADVHERLGRVAFAAVMSVGNRIWWEWGIGLNNAITGAISADLDPCGSLIRPHLSLATPDPGTAVAEPVLVIVYAVVSLLLLFSLAFRLGTIDVLIAAGGLAAFCWATPQTEFIAQWYQRLSVGTLFGQVLLVIGLRTAHALSSIGAGLGATLLSIVVLLICRSLLSTLSSQRSERSGSTLGYAMALAARRLILKVI